MTRWLQWVAVTSITLATANASLAQEDWRDRGAQRGEARGERSGNHDGRGQRDGRGERQGDQDNRYDANRYGDDGNRYEANRYDDGNSERSGQGYRGDGRRDGGRGDRNRWDGRGERYGQHDGWNRDRWDRNDGNRYGHHDGWNRDQWRRGWRHGWNGHRWHSPTRYTYPRGYGRRAWSVGLILPSVYYGSNYYIDWQPYGLSAPPYGARWIRVDDDLLLVYLSTGEVLDVLSDFFY